MSITQQGTAAVQVGRGTPSGALTPVVAGTDQQSGGTVSAAGAARMSAASAGALGDPIEVHLAAAVGGAPGAALDVTPPALDAQPDPNSPVGVGVLTITNRGATDQTVWVSGEVPHLMTLQVQAARASQPQQVTLRVRVDLAYAAAFGAQAPTSAQIFVTGAATTATIQVTWRPLPYGSM